MKLKLSTLFMMVLLVTACSSGGITRGGTLKHADRTRTDNRYAGYGYVSKNILCQFGTPAEMGSSSSEKFLCLIKDDRDTASDYWYAWCIVEYAGGRAAIKPYYGRYYKDYKNNSGDDGYVELKDNLVLKCEIYDGGNLIKIAGTLSSEDNSWSKNIDELLVCIKYEPENAKPSTP